MKVIRFVFAPLFWLRDIRDSTVQMERLLRWMYCLDVRHSALSDKQKTFLLSDMMAVRRNRAAKGCPHDANVEDALEMLEMDN